MRVRRAGSIFFAPADEKDREKFSYLKEMSNFAYKQKICLLEDDEKCSLCCGMLG